MTTQINRMARSNVQANKHDVFSRGSSFPSCQQYFQFCRCRGEARTGGQDSCQVLQQQFSTGANFASSRSRGRYIKGNTLVLEQPRMLADLMVCFALITFVVVFPGSFFAQLWQFHCPQFLQIIA
ncbi:hypothetical protein VPH35_090814 [Triticum aestivum]